jgi:hypothetical protein
MVLQCLPPGRSYCLGQCFRLRQTMRCICLSEACSVYQENPQKSMIFEQNAATHPTKNCPNRCRSGRLRFAVTHAPTAPAPTGATSGVGQTCAVGWGGVESASTKGRRYVNLGKPLVNLGHAGYNHASPGRLACFNLLDHLSSKWLGCNALVSCHFSDFIQQIAP